MSTVYFALNAVRWRTPPRDIAALVTDSSRASFVAELFHFGDKPRELEADLFLLSAGDYAVTLAPVGASNEPPIHRQVLRVEGPKARVPLQLPARLLCELRVAAL